MSNERFTSCHYINNQIDPNFIISQPELFPFLSLFLIIGSSLDHINHQWFLQQHQIKLRRETCKLTDGNNDGSNFSNLQFIFCGSLKTLINQFDQLISRRGRASQRIICQSLCGVTLIKQFLISVYRSTSPRIQVVSFCNRYRQHNMLGGSLRGSMLFSFLFDTRSENKARF